MNPSEEKLISRGLDGALNEKERTALEALLARDPSAAARAKSWAGIGDQLRRQAATAPSPDPQTAWHAIRRTIRTDANPDRHNTRVPGWSLWRPGYAGALAACTIIGVLAWTGLRLIPDNRTATAITTTPPASERVEWVVAEIPGATTMIYTDAETDLTVIWMDLAQNVDPRDT